MERNRRTDRWRRGHGVCYICGQPLGAAPRLQPEEEDMVDPLERVLTEECPVRLALMRFNMLGDYHEAHLVDEYTFLERPAGDDRSFLTVFKKLFADCIRPLNQPAFDRLWAQLAKPPSIYDEALGVIARAAEKRTVPTCGRCNRGMYRLYEHTLTVYRCFPVTANSESALMELRTVHAHNARKAVQQIALFFHYDGTVWHAKPSEQMLRDAALWRCIAFLHSWGGAPSGNGIRLRLIAIFYASFYIYNTGSSMQMLSFEDWHTHVWRPFYHNTFGLAPLFFRIDQTAAAYRFDIARAKNGTECARIVAGMLNAIGKNELHAWERTLTEPSHDMQYTVLAAMRAATRGVKDEASLLMFLSERKGAMYGANRLLHFFCCNLAERKDDAAIQNRLTLIKRSIVAASLSLR